MAVVFLSCSPKGNFASSSTDDFVARGSAQYSLARIRRHSATLTFVRILAPVRPTLPLISQNEKDFGLPGVLFVSQ